MKLILSPFAELDFYAIKEWYTLQSEPALKVFEHELEKTFGLIATNPYQFPVIKKNYRKTILKRFPYSIYFAIYNEQVIVLAIVHQKRHPRVWKKRIK